MSKITISEDLIDSQPIGFGSEGAAVTPVDASHPLPVTNAGTPTAIGPQAGANSLSVVPNSDTAFPVVGNAASGAADAGNPVKAGGRYNTAAPTLANGQRGDLQLNAGAKLLTAPFTYNVGADAKSNDLSYGSADSNGYYPVATAPYVFNGASYDRQRGDTNGLVVQSALSSTFWNYAAATGGIVNTATAVTIKAAAGASVRNYLKSISIAHDALGAATEFAVRDGAAGTVLWRGKLQTTAVDSSGGAGTIVFDPPLKGSANTLMEVVTLTAVTGGVFVNAQGFTGT